MNSAESDLNSFNFSIDRGYISYSTKTGFTVFRIKEEEDDGVEMKHHLASNLCETDFTVLDNRNKVIYAKDRELICYSTVDLNKGTTLFTAPFIKFFYNDDVILAVTKNSFQIRSTSRFFPSLLDKKIHNVEDVIETCAISRKLNFGGYMLATTTAKLLGKINLFSLIGGELKMSELWGTNSYELHKDEKITNLEFDYHAKLLASTSTSGLHVKLWKVDKKNISVELVCKFSRSYWRPASITSLSFSVDLTAVDTTRFILASSSNGTVHIFKIVPNITRAVHHKKCSIPTSHMDNYSIKAVFSRHYGRIYIADIKGNFLVYKFAPDSSDNFDPELELKHSFRLYYTNTEETSGDKTITTKDYCFNRETLPDPPPSSAIWLN